MKAILLCCLLSVVYSGNVNYENVVQLGMVHKKADEVVGSGFRRGGGSSNAECTANCFTKFLEMCAADAETAKDLELSRSAYRYADQFKPSVMNTMCRTYNSTADCLRPCPHSSDKTLVTEVLSTYRYKCIDTKFHEYAPCYFRVNNEMLATCNTKCGTKKTALENSLAREMTSINDVDILIRDMCGYLACDSDCDYDKVKADCGADAARVLQVFYKKTIDVLRSTMAKKGFALPSVCSNVGSRDDE